MTLSHTAAWLVLLAAGLLEIVWSVSMKGSEGFTRPLLTGITIVAAWLSFWLLGLSLKVLPVGPPMRSGPGSVRWSCSAGHCPLQGAGHRRENRLNPADRRRHSGTQNHERSLNDMRRPRPWGELAMSATARPGCALAGRQLVIAFCGCERGQSALEGTQWRLTEWTLSSLDPRDFEITAEFADGEVSGHSGVNSYGGPYTVGRVNHSRSGRLRVRRWRARSRRCALRVRTSRCSGRRRRIEWRRVG